MKTTGITRRIDELGRVVIPKELRKNMHIKSGELLEIFLSDKETISLKKHTIIDKNEEFINLFVKTLSDKLNSNIFVTNLDEIVFSNLDDMLSQKLSNEFDNNFNNFKLNHYLTKDYKLINPFNILPISPNGDLAGYFIIEKMNNKNEELIKFALSFFESYFETI